MARVSIDMTGQQFGNLTVLYKDTTRKSRKGTFWICKCICGTEKSINRGDLISPRGVRSCGCMQHAPTLKYRLLYPSEYNTWRDMRKRCYNPNRPEYNNYGGRGIIICDAWYNSFDIFFEDMGPKPGPSFSIERINNNGNYEPGNCKWATATEQSRNRRYNVIQDKQEADYIRELYSTGNFTHFQLSQIFNCDEPIIWQIINNYTWT